MLRGINPKLHGAGLIRAFFLALSLVLVAFLAGPVLAAPEVDPDDPAMAKLKENLAEIMAGSRDPEAIKDAVKEYVQQRLERVDEELRGQQGNDLTGESPQEVRVNALAKEAQDALRAASYEVFEWAKTQNIDPNTLVNPLLEGGVEGAGEYVPFFATFAGDEIVAAANEVLGIQITVLTETTGATEGTESTDETDTTESTQPTLATTLTTATTITTVTTSTSSETTATTATTDTTATTATTSTTATTVTSPTS